MLTGILKPDEGKIVSLEMDPNIEGTVIATVCNKLKGLNTICIVDF